MNPRRNYCMLCHGEGKVIDRRESRHSLYPVYVDCAWCTGNTTRGWKRLLEREERLRADAERRAVAVGELPKRKSALE